MSDADSIDLGWGAGSAAGAAAPADLWQVNTRGRKVIEMTQAELAASVRAGKLTARSLVWSDGMGEWTPIGDVPRLAQLLRESEPPPSGTRPRPEELTLDPGLYGASAETTTDTGGLAVYERPLAMIEFPETVEPAEPADEPTPAFVTPKALASSPTGSPRPAAGKKSAPRAAEQDPPPPPLPPPPSNRATLPGPLFLPPVSASPLGAALSSTAAATSPAPPPAAEAPAVETAPLVKPPRPAIEFLPPIMVLEKEEDDGASSILELPLHGALQDVPFSESTLVLSGRRARRWVPLNAAIALGVGSACLASALTALVVRSRPAPPPRIVERVVTVQAAPVARSAPAAQAPEAPPATAPSSAETDAKQVAASEAPRSAATGERSAAKAEASKSEATGASARSRDWRQDPGALAGAEAKPNATRREARAGFPTDPGF